MSEMVFFVFAPLAFNLMTLPAGAAVFVVLPSQSLPLGGKVARNAPDEGEMSGSCNKPTRIIAIPANFPLISHLR